MVLVVVPLDEIKIYKAFVLGLGVDADPANVAIVQAVIAMARPLRCEVVTWPKATISPVRCPRRRLSSGQGLLPGGVRRQDVVAAALALEILRCAQDDRSDCRGGSLGPA